MKQSAGRMLGTLAMGLVIFCLIPLLGWGLGDLVGFFAEPARLAFVVVTIIAQVVIASRMPEAGQNRVDVKEMAQEHVWTLRAMQTLPTLILFLAPMCDRRGWLVMGDNAAMRWLGVILYGAGFAFMHLAERALDRYFTIDVAMLEGHQLVTTGPYAHIRHPRYLGIGVFAVGMALAFRSWGAVALALLAIAALVYRCKAEDEMLHEAFGSEWEQWAAKSWRLIPWVW